MKISILNRWILAGGAMVVATASTAAVAIGGGGTPVSYVASIGGQGVGVSPGDAQLGVLAQIDARDDVVLDLNAARAVAGPAGGRWVLAATTEGGVCVSTPDTGFCGVSANSLAAGRASASEYPADRLVPGSLEKGHPLVTPSGKPGVRVGVAPAGATEVVARTASGTVSDRAAVVNGLYQVSVPPQGSGAKVDFVGSAGVLATRPAEG